jgi:hypothetical protein
MSKEHLGPKGVRFAPERCYTNVRGDLTEDPNAFDIGNASELSKLSKRNTPEL